MIAHDIFIFIGTMVMLTLGVCALHERHYSTRRPERSELAILPAARRRGRRKARQD
jgi:hypothetical protein